MVALPRMASPPSRAGSVPDLATDPPTSAEKTPSCKKREFSVYRIGGQFKKFLSARRGQFFIYTYRRVETWSSHTRQKIPPLARTALFGVYHIEGSSTRNRDVLLESA